MHNPHHQDRKSAQSINFRSIFDCIRCGWIHVQIAKAGLYKKEQFGSDRGGARRGQGIIQRSAPNGMVEKLIPIPAPDVAIFFAAKSNKV